MKSNWLTFDEPYEVEDQVGTYTEVVLTGAADNAEPIDGPKTMVVAEDEWDADFTHRTIRKLARVSVD